VKVVLLPVLHYHNQVFVIFPLTISCSVALKCVRVRTLMREYPHSTALCPHENAGLVALERVRVRTRMRDWWHASQHANAEDSGPVANCVLRSTRKHVKCCVLHSTRMLRASQHEKDACFTARKACSATRECVQAARSPCRGCDAVLRHQLVSNVHDALV
jgi:hypothetical protein